MTNNDTDSADPPAAPASQRLPAANDDGSDAKPTVDPRILVVARTIGRQIAREQLHQLQAANDNTPRDD